MGQAKNRAIINANLEITNVQAMWQEFANRLETQVQKSYPLTSPAAKLYMEDCDVTTRQPLQELIAGLMFWKHLCEMAAISQTDTPAQVMDESYEWTKKMVQDGTYKIWGTALDEMVRMAMVYRCYEPWEMICENYVANSNFPDSRLYKELLGKTVSFLYDAYLSVAAFDLAPDMEDIA